jgi:DNA-binding transcriptional regulator YiaG
MGSINVDEKIQSVRSIVAEAEARDVQTWAVVRGLLGEIEEELRTLRIETAQREVQYFTRREFAERLGVSEATLKRAEDRGDIKPAVTVMSLERYSSLQLEWADEIFSKKREPTGRPRERKGNAPRN